MPAGDSAGTEARRHIALAEAHAQAAAEARATAARYGLAEITEKRTAAVLAPLSGIGHHLLADRSWPGARRAQVDLVIVGPGGVFIVDTKAWASVRIESGRVFRDQEDVTDDLLGLADLADTAQADLAEVGLAPGEVRPVVVLAGRQGIDATVAGIRIVGERDVLRLIASYGNRLTTRQVDIVLTRALTLFPQARGPAPVVASVPEPVVPPRPAVIEQEALLSAEEVTAALLEGIMASPIEEWMAFLHPQQAKLVRRSFSGPSRIRGPAGTGKTVVGLHRAAHLARTRPGKVLVTTYVRTLPAVLNQLLARLAPDLDGRVEFSGIHAFALRVLQERGVTVRLHPQGSAEAFDAAWEKAGQNGPLGAHVRDRRYWEEEVQHVLKGRGITDFDQYADLPRTGRRQRLTTSQRRAVWALHEAYDAELRRRHLHDYADVILMAEAELTRKPMAGEYASVIVDEAQDLSCAMVRMLFGMVGDAPDGLTLIGDGQQSIYPGGYTLGEAGISLSGRGVVLDINYRNTAQIVSFASRLVAEDEYADIEGMVARGDVPRSVPRVGPEPVIDWCTSWRDRDTKMVERVQAVTRELGTGLGDVGVLCATRKGVERAARALAASGLPVMLLENYSGVPDGAVKVGTIKRAKGLEFKQVLIPDVRKDQTGHQPPPDDGAERERWELSRRELYVAMTRARDGLWVAIM